MPIEMKIRRIALDPLTNMPIVLLKESDGDRTLPIWIGLLEASAIASHLEKVPVIRPMTHDLMATMLGALGARVERITVVDLRENTYFAVVNLVGPQGIEEVDARPSDALAIALRAGAPIFVEERVIEGAERMDGDTQKSDARSEENLADFLENLPNEEFGKYKM